MQIIQKVKDFIQTHQLIDDNDKLIVGLSGGADSMALLTILRKLGYKFIAAHCNFHLRGEESNRDENFVQGYCKYNNIEYTSVSFDTYAYMKEKRISLEMAARDLRYNWFNQVKAEYNADKIAIAHHQDDSVETVLINLIRGSGIRGLTGIPERNGDIIRPMLNISRDEIMEYLAEKKIPFVNDSTNMEDDYTRNKIRLNIMPQLEAINPSVKQTISRTARYLSDVETIYNSQVIYVKNKIFDGKFIDIEKLKEQIGAKNILFEILHPYGFTASAIDDIYESLDGISGKIFLSGQYRLIKDRKNLILDKIGIEQEKIYEIPLGTDYLSEPMKLSFKLLENNDEFALEKSRGILFADFSKIIFPLQIRKWRQGDKFIPFGMKGSKKISDYFTDKKYSIADKENAWLLCSANNEIIWIIGERSDNRFKIGEKTSRILKVEILD